jgi:5-methylcytosine-specific restriction endonuclease McrA
MKPYTKTYLNYFGYDVSDFIPCEVCNAKSVDIHHIQARSIAKSKENDITNLMALCRKCHTEKGDKKQFREFLQNIHNKKLNVQQP